MCWYSDAPGHVGAAARRSATAPSISGGGGGMWAAAAAAAAGCAALGAGAVLMASTVRRARSAASGDTVPGICATITTTDEAEDDAEPSSPYRSAPIMMAMAAAKYIDV